SFHASATTEFFSLSLHDALPIFTLVIHAKEEDIRLWKRGSFFFVIHHLNDLLTVDLCWRMFPERFHNMLHLLHPFFSSPKGDRRSEEHTSELQSRENLVCRLLLE